MPLAQACKVALLIGSTLSVLLIFATLLYAPFPPRTVWQSILLYGIGLVVPIAGAVLSQDLFEASSHPHYMFTGMMVAMLGCPLLLVLIGGVLWELPPREQFLDAWTLAVMIGAFGFALGGALISGLLQLLNRLITLQMEDVNWGAMQITFALLAPIELFVCWMMLLPS